MGVNVKAGEDQHINIQRAMYTLMERDTGDFSPDQICRALHAALDGDVRKALSCINESR